MKLKAALDLMHTGSRLMLMHEQGGQPHWYLVPGGPVDHDLAETIKGMPNVHAQEDGLFPGHSQTWRMG